MDVASGLHVTQNVILQLVYALQTIRHVLVLLDVANDFGGLGALRKVDELRLLDDGRNTVLDERQIGEVDTEEGNAWRVGLVQCIAILEEVLR